MRCYSHPHVIINLRKKEFFLFPGKSCAAIALPPMKPWPIQSGFSVSCWFRLDPLNNLHIETDKPYLYCLRTSKGIGYSGHFVGGCLVITGKVLNNQLENGWTKLSNLGRMGLYFNLKFLNPFFIGFKLLQKYCSKKSFFRII